ncbi:hypothetical protein HHX47_DHR8000352 [Lentinula edodes]|nr:hypothetical protein HHX47_DHR8000352 [Lentinula edodes]
MSLPREYALLKNGEMMVSEADYQGMFKARDIQGETILSHPPDRWVLPMSLEALYEAYPTLLILLPVRMANSKGLKA